MSLSQTPEKWWKLQKNQPIKKNAGNKKDFQGKLLKILLANYGPTTHATVWIFSEFSTWLGLPDPKFLAYEIIVCNSIADPEETTQTKQCWNISIS